MPRMMIRDCELAYREYGSGFPIVFLHNFLSDAGAWHSQIEAFAQDYRCIVPELWGHGESGLLNGSEVSVESLAQDLWQFLCQLEIKSCAFVGHSLGGMVGAHLAHAHPECFTGLVIMSAYLGPDTEQKRSEYLPMMTAVEQTEFFAPEFVEFIAPYFFSPNICNTNPDLLQSFKHSLSAISFLRIPTVTSVGRAIYNRGSFLEQLKSLRVPTLYMIGEDDMVRSLSETQAMVDLTPHCAQVRIPDSGHTPTLEQPEFVNHHLGSFFKECAKGFVSDQKSSFSVA